MTRVTEDPLRREAKGQGNLSLPEISTRKTTEEMCQPWEGEALDRMGPVRPLGAEDPPHGQASPHKALRAPGRQMSLVPQSRTCTHGSEATEQKSPRSSRLGAGPRAGASWDEAATDPRNVWPDNPQGRKGRNPTADKPSIRVPSDREM